jgi:hypothetical protein
MTDPNHTKPGQRPDAAEGASGKVVHDSRGNAVWQWVKDTGRQAIESTSALLKKLEVPELKVEDQKDAELRLEEDVDKGGGYDPYGTRVGTRKPTERKSLPPIPNKKR